MGVIAQFRGHGPQEWGTLRFGFHVGPFGIGSFRSGRSARRARAQTRKTVHTLTGTVTGNEPGTVLVRITSVERGVSSAVIGSTMAVPSVRRFPVGSGVQVRQRAADQAVLSVEPLS